MADKQAKTLQQLHAEAFEAVTKTNSEADWKSYGYDNLAVWERDYVMGQRDLYWLCTNLLGLALVEEAHRPITDDFFIRKNPYIQARSWKDAVAKQSTIKNRMLLYPRGSFKSTIDRSDVVQWIICFPNVRIFMMTAEESLAVSFVRDIKKHFAVPENTTLTRFQMLYTAHCVSAKKKEAENQFTSRARTEDAPEPTLLGLSLGMSTAGKHCDLCKFDDCVSDINSGPRATNESRKTVSDDLKLKRYLVDAYGYRDYVGTIYDPDDGYAAIQRTIPDLHVLRKPALTVKKESLKKPKEILGKEDYDLLFAADGDGVPRLTYEALMTEKHVDEYIYSCQFLLEPLASRTVKFTEELLNSHKVGSEGLPQAGTFQTVMAWDFAYSDEKGRDFSVGSVGWFCITGPLAGRCFVVDMVRGRFSKSELAHQVAKMAARWRVEKIGIEKSSGAEFLENDIMREVHRMGYSDCPQPEWFSVDAQKNAKNARAEGTETLLITDRLYFSSEIAILEDVIKEFVNFKPGSKRKDDAVDSIGHLCRYLPTHIEVPRTQQEKNQAVHDMLVQKQINELIFIAQPKPEPPPPPMPTEIDGVPIYQSYEHILLGR